MLRLCPPEQESGPVVSYPNDMNEITVNSKNGLKAWSKWLQSVGIDPVTGWRWRRRGWIMPLNIAGRLYVTDDAVAVFEQRAAAGEFAKELRAPKRK